MLKYIIALFLLITFAFSKEYPRTFQQLSTPLFESKEPLMKLSKIDSIHKCSTGYLKDLQKLEEFGCEVDKNSDKKEIKRYLAKLRKLQKDHDFIVYKIHENINSAIDKNDYKQFLELTDYEFDGLLKNRALFTKALQYYNENKEIKKNLFFEKKIKNRKLEIATTKEFFNILNTSTYNSKIQQRSKKNKVHLTAEDSGNHTSIFLENFNPYSVTVRVNGSYENFNVSSTKNIFTLKSGEKKEYTKLYKKLGAITTSYSYSYSWIVGSVDAIHNDKYIYRLPYAKGKKYTVTQGFNGKVTHKGHSQYAIDFGMREGTKLFAARDGVVVKTKENSNKGGYDKKFASSGNYVTIEHDDSTFAIYYHLKQNGVGVNIGQKVRRGEFIAYSGNTGYSSGPHLHFAVFKANTSMRTQTIPIKLISKGGVINVPRKGTQYTAI